MTNRTRTLADRPVGDIVAEDYRRAAVFERLGIDFCCGGRQTLRAACRERDLAPDEVERALLASDERAAEARQGDPEPARSGFADPRTWDLATLVRHIVDVHHRYVRETLPVLERFSSKVARVHGWSRPELLEIEALVDELSAEMEDHLRREEEVVFPRIRALPGATDRTLDPDDPVGEPDDPTASPGASLAASSSASTDGLPEGSLRLLGELEDDHARTGSLVKRIRELSGGFTAPDGACDTYRALYATLEEFERDLHRHVHLENNVLFPRAAALARGADAGTARSETSSSGTAGSERTGAAGGGTAGSGSRARRR